MVNLEDMEPGTFQVASAGENKMPVVLLRHKNGSSAMVYLHGAHVASWKDKDGNEQLFMSKKCVYKPGSAFRGGIPICWPQFADVGSLPKHGFARNSDWTVTDMLGGDQVSVVLSLTSNNQTKKVFPYDFKAQYSVVLFEDNLECHLTVMNTGTTAFTFTTALHTYYSVPDVRKVQLTGLQGLVYEDKVRDKIREVEKRQKVSLAGETDRVYENNPGGVSFIDGIKTISLHKHNLPDTVLWNCWNEKAAAMADMDDEEWIEYVCVESGAIASPVTVEPRASWTGMQKLTTDFGAGAVSCSGRGCSIS